MQSVTSGLLAPESVAAKYLTFRLGGAEYGVGILQVREIVAPTSITPVPQTPPYVRGVMNLRGRVIPVVDLGEKLGAGAAQRNAEACIIVVDVDGLAGLLVDAVCDVLELCSAQIAPLPASRAVMPVDRGYVTGLAQGREALTILLDIERVLAREPSGEARPLDAAE